MAASPAAVERYVKLGFEVLLEDGAGDGASFPNSAYETAGARVVGGDEAFAADVVLKVRAPRSGDGVDEIQRLREGGTLISFVFPAQNEELLERCAGEA